jgi:hypothetical protein
MTEFQNNILNFCPRLNNGKDESCEIKGFADHYHSIINICPDKIAQLSIKYFVINSELKILPLENKFA